MVGPQNRVPSFQQLTTKINLADGQSPDAGANLSTALVIIYAVLYAYAEVS